MTKQNQNSNSNGGNANSQSPAGAGGQSTVGAGGRTPLPLSALEDALVNQMGNGAETNENTPLSPGQSSGQDGGNAPEGGAVDNLQNQDLPPGDQNNQEQEQNGQQLDGDQQGEQQEQQEPGQGQGQGQEQDQGQGQEQEQGQDGLPIGVKKRIGQLQGQIRQLQQQLDEQQQQQESRSTRPEAGANGAGDLLADVNSPAELSRRREAAEEGLDEADTLLAQLPVAPERVEAFLREKGIILKNDQGEEDFSPQRMSVALTRARTGLRQVLRAVPRRETFLQQQEQAHGQAVKVVPWIADRTDPRYAQMQGIVRQFPGLKSAPNWEYWVAAAVTGHEHLMKAARQAQGQRGGGNGGGNGNNGATGNRAGGSNANNNAGAGNNGQQQQQRRLPNSGSGGTSQSNSNPARAKVQAARERVTKEHNRDALAGFLETTGIGTS